MFAHGNLGQAAVFVASLSNSSLLVIRIGSVEQAEAVVGLRSWLLEWPVAGKVSRQAKVPPRRVSHDDGRKKRREMQIIETTINLYTTGT